MIAGRRLSARIALGLAALVAVSGVTLGTASGASAASPDILVSTDGVNFSTTLAHGLFDDSRRLVPGDPVSKSLWVKNPTGSAAAFRLSLKSLSASSPVYAQALDLAVFNSTTGTTVSGSAATFDSCSVLARVDSLAGGAAVKMVVTFTLADLDQTVAQNERVGFDLLAALRGTEAGPFADSACSDAGSIVSSNNGGSLSGYSHIAYTGGTLPTPLFMLGGLLLGVGVFLVVGKRRRRSER